MQVCTERDDQDVCVEFTVVGRDALGDRIDLTNRRLNEPYAGLGEVTVRVTDRRRRRAPEHDVELREAEHEAVALIDQDDIDIPANLRRTPGGKLEAAEASAEHDTPHTGMLFA